MAWRIFVCHNCGQDIGDVVAALAGCLVLGVILRWAIGAGGDEARRARDTAYDRELFAKALQSVQAGVLIRDLIVDPKPVVFANRAFYEMAGYDEGEIIGKSPEILFGWQTDKGNAEEFRNSEENGRDFISETLTYRKDGSSFWCAWRSTHIAGADGRRSHQVILLSDVTDVRRTQETLLKAKEDAERAGAVKAAFLATMSHEIRTPMNGVMGVLDLLGDGDLSAEQKKLLGVAKSSGRALLDIINDVLDYSRIEAGKMRLSIKPFRLREMVEDAVSVVRLEAEAKGLEITVEAQDAVPGIVSGDAGRIRQILLNLLSNAVKFTEKGTVATRVIHLMDRDDSGHKYSLLRFEVSDTGLGISSEDQEKIFRDFSQVERSFSRRFGGTGLGLAITRRMVRLMDGEIGVESRIGQGSKFWFMLSLPVAENLQADENGDDKNEAKSEENHSCREIKVLLVEDNPTNQMIAGCYLDKAGLKHDIANDGAEAISRVKSGTYDLILMDVSMPEMDGMEATRRIREIGGWAENVPIIALTAHTMAGDKERCLEAGMNDHLAKPMNYKELCAAVAKWTKKGGVGEAAEDGTAEAAAEDGGLPLLNPAFFADMRKIIGREAARKVGETFLRDGDERIGRLLDGCGAEAKDFEAIAALAHAMKGGGASCGLERFFSMMSELERAAARKDDAGVTAIAGKVGGVYAFSRKLLQEEISGSF